MDPTQETRLVTASADVAQLAERLARAPEVAFDTEFHLEKSYWPRLMLVQLATRDEVALVDPLAPGSERSLAQLFRTLSEAGTLVVGHALGRDLQVWNRWSGTLPARIFDTQVSAAFTGRGEQLALGKLVQDVLGVELDKSYTMADWSRRPLPAAQVTYAAGDVLHLLPLADRLREELSRRGRLAWAEEECQRLLDPALVGPRPPEEAWRSVAGRSKAGTREAQVLRALAAERERIAREKDVPPKFVLPDDVLSDLARRAPTTRNTLAGESHRRSGSVVQAHSDRWVDAIRRALAEPPEPPPPPPPTPLTTAQDGAITLARLLVTGIARAEGIGPSLLWPPLERALPSLLQNPPVDRGDLDQRLGLGGWRRELVSTPVWQLLSGSLAARLHRTSDGISLEWEGAPESR